MKDKTNSKNRKKNKKKEIKEKEENDEFLPLNPEELSKHYYSFTNILYNNKMNYEHDAFKRKYIGQFVLGQKLGQGTFGIVVLGTHQITGEKVAVKILDKDRILQEADKTRIEREIKILKNMRHNNIVHLFDVKETPSSLYIIMEYICGKELFDYIIEKKYLSELEACNFYQQMVSGIEYLGKIGVAHRDLKPENLLLDEQKNIKIVDFGLSNIYPNNELLITACGSPCYAAPEMIKGEPYIGLRVDIWSSGIVLFAMLCGYLPFEDEDNEALYKKITAGKFKTPKHLSDCCKDFLNKILNVNPNKRYTIDQIKNHPWFNIINPKINMSMGLLLNVYIVPIDENILEEMVNDLKFNEAEVRANLIANNHNHTTTTYYLLLQKKLREGQKSICDMKSKEFLNYLKNPLNLLSSYDYNLTLIIQLRIKKNKEFLEQNNNNDEMNHRTQSGTILNKNKANRLYNKLNSEKQLISKSKDSNQEIKIKTIFNKKKIDIKKKLNYKRKTDNNQLFDSKNNAKINKNKNNEKIGKIKKKNINITTKENFNQSINNYKSNDIMEMNIEEQESIVNENKIKEYKIIFNKKKKEQKENHQYSISFENPTIEEKIKNELNNKETSPKDKNDDYYDNNTNNDNNNEQKNKNPLNGIKPKRETTNSIMPKKIFENKFKLKTITDRSSNYSNIEKKKIKKILEKYHTDKSKSKSKNKTYKPTRENTDLYMNKSINQKRNSNNEKKKQREDRKGFIKIEELMKRMKKRVINNIKENSQEPKNTSHNNYSKDKIYYLLTDKEKMKGNKNLNDGHNIYSDNSKDINIREYHHKKNMVKFKRNITSNNSSKLVKNLMQIHSFQSKEKKDPHQKKELKAIILKSNERKTREQKEVNQRGKYIKKGFIDTSVSFDISHDGARGRNSTKPKKVSKVQSQKRAINLNVKNKKNEKNYLNAEEANYIEEDNDSNPIGKNSKNEDEIKRNQKELKYLKLKAKNKKFVILKKNEDNNKENENEKDYGNNDDDINKNLNINNEKEMMKLKTNININTSKQNGKKLLKRNILENGNENYSTKNYFNIKKNNNNDFETIVHDDLPSYQTERSKKEILKKKIKTLKTQGNLIKKLIIQKNNLYNSLNDSKKHKFIPRTINSNLNDKISSFNNDENFKSIEEIFSKTYFNNSSSRKVFPFSTKIKNRFNRNELTNQANDYTESKDKEEFHPFDLNLIFMNNIRDIKSILKNFINAKKWKYKVKKNGYLIYKNENQIDFDINKIDSNINLYVVRIAKKEGNSQICKEIIKNIVSKLK